MTSTILVPGLTQLLRISNKVSCRMESLQQTLKNVEVDTLSPCQGTTGLHYGSEAWTLTVTYEKGLDGCWTRLLHSAFNVH